MNPHENKIYFLNNKFVTKINVYHLSAFSTNFNLYVDTLTRTSFCSSTEKVIGSMHHKKRIREMEQEMGNMTSRVRLQSKMKERRKTVYEKVLKKRKFEIKIKNVNWIHFFYYNPEISYVRLESLVKIFQTKLVRLKKARSFISHHKSVFHVKKNYTDLF